MHLVLAATPIGNIGDASPRLVEALSSAEVIAAEDTRRLRRLLRDLEVTPTGRVVSYFEGNEAARTPQLIAAMLAGETVLLVTDAGMPSVSDPGYRLVAAAVESGLSISAIPGPSAVLTALALSGLPVDRFCFEGFLPRKAGERSRRLAGLVAEPRTMVFFEAPHRTRASLQALADAFGPDRPAAVARELTKTYEEVRRGPLGELVEWAAGAVRGEITIVVAGALPLDGSGGAGERDWSKLVREVEGLVGQGMRGKAAVADVAARHGVNKRDLYDLVHKPDPPAEAPGASSPEQGES